MILFPWNICRKASLREVFLIWAEAAEAVDHTTARIIQEVIHIQAVQDQVQDQVQDPLTDLRALHLRIHLITRDPEVISAEAAALTITMATMADAAMRVVSAAA